VLDPAELRSVTDSGRLTFHLLGDVGGVKAPQDQQIVALNLAADAHRAVDPARFAYVMGDVVYYNGEAEQYYPQFYEPYADYPCPIFSVPGNHDGTPLPGSTSLQAWMANFATPTPMRSPDARDVPRLTMTQPNCYWTLTGPLVTVVGLYSNVPENGYLDPDQATWLAGELAAAPTDRPLIVTSHHPALSLDRYHGGSAPMLQVIDTAIAASKRVPDLVAAGHVHDYQRWERTINGATVPFVVAGAGGYWHLHEVLDPNLHKPTLPYPVPQANAKLVSYVDDRHGYLRVTATAGGLTLEYVTVPRPQESWHTPGTVYETCTIPLR
ncbi:MAG TPA: metallophosphoesterase, partial [Microlunatus sp.]|nr:metallophosphoesterase [Microlunatus sp.]